MMQYSDSSASETSGTSGISGRDVKVRPPLPGQAARLTGS